MFSGNLAFLFLNVTSGFHLVVNPLYLHSRRHLLILDFDNDVPTSSRVFLISVDVMKGFYFTKERILRSSTLVVFCGLPGLLMLLSSPVLDRPTVDLATPKVFAISLIDVVFFSA